MTIFLSFVASGSCIRSSQGESNQVTSRLVESGQVRSRLVMSGLVEVESRSSRGRVEVESRSRSSHVGAGRTSLRSDSNSQD